MRNTKALVLIGLALFLSMTAALYAARWLGQRAKPASTQVVTAAIDIDMGARITPQMLTTLEWPTASAPPGAFTSPAQLTNRVARVAIPRGDALLDRKLAPEGSQAGLSAVISEGKRAMAVRVNDVVGVAGFALPGTYVDVMVNLRQDAGGRENHISMTVLEQVLVLAVAQEASRDDLKPKVVSAVTLELSPQDAEKLDLARSIGTLSLVLRNQADKERVATTGITREQLLNLKTVSNPRTVEAAPAVRKVAAPGRTRPPAEPSLQRPPRDCVEVIANGTRTVTCF